MKSYISIARIGFLLIFLAAFSFALGACEPLVTIRIHNQTNETLKIFTGDTFIDSAAPGKEVNWEIETIYNAYQISAKNIDGSTIYSKLFTREELRINNWRVVMPPESD